MLITEMTAYYRAKGMTLSDALEELFEQFGFCYEYSAEIYMEGLDGAARMEKLMNTLRNNPPKDFDKEPVAVVSDYLTGIVRTGDVTSPTGLPKSNVLSYRLKNDDVIVVRPSGTEPKIKFYYLLRAKDADDGASKSKRYEAALFRLAGI